MIVYVPACSDVLSELNIHDETQKMPVFDHPPLDETPCQAEDTLKDRKYSHSFCDKSTDSSLRALVF